MDLVERVNVYIQLPPLTTAPRLLFSESKRKREREREEESPEATAIACKRLR